MFLCRDRQLANVYDLLSHTKCRRLTEMRFYLDKIKLLLVVQKCVMTLDLTENCWISIELLRIVVLEYM